MKVQKKLECNVKIFNVAGKGIIILSGCSTNYLDTYRYFRAKVIKNTKGK